MALQSNDANAHLERVTLKAFKKKKSRSRQCLFAEIARGGNDVLENTV